MRTSENVFDYPQGQVFERPDGFWWRDPADGQEYGPFASLLEALEDMEGTGGDIDGIDTESPEEAESEIGIADWIDPETGEPAEESVPRLEEH